MRMKADPIPIDVKIVLLGDSRIFSLLSIYEENFGNIFKVKSEFDWESERSGDSIKEYIKNMQNLIMREKIRALDRGGEKMKCGQFNFHSCVFFTRTRS